MKLRFQSIMEKRPKMFTVWATTEEPQNDAIGGYFDSINEVLAALPDRSALRRYINIYYPKTRKTIRAYLPDVGPWNIDDPYWEPGEAGAPRVQVDPEAPTYSRRHLQDKRPLNPSGLDISIKGWVMLGVPLEKVAELKDGEWKAKYSDFVVWWFD